MAGEGPHIRIKLDTDQPVALSDFVGSFVGIGNQFEKFVAENHAGIRAEGEFFVKEVRAGCIEADLVAVVQAAAATLPGMSPVDLIDKGQVLTAFVVGLRDKIGRYFQPGGRDPKATKSDLADYHKTVAAIARDPVSSANIEAAVFESDGRQVRSAFKFRAIEARLAEAEIAAHRLELEAKTDNNVDRVLLRFVRPSVEAGKPGKKGGERGVIDSIQARALPILYASELAEQRVRHELLQLEANIFRTLFDVDVNVERSASGRPIAYRIKQVHDVIEDGDEDLLSGGPGED